MSEATTPDTSPSEADLSEQLIGTTIADRYKVERLLGSGGMGAVFLVQHVHMRKHFALKMLHADTSQNPEIVARFEREAMASGHVDHPNIAIATDFGRTQNGAFFLVLEYLEGQRLRDALASGPIEVRRAVHIIRQVASALERSHELGIIHRDLKPENIMLVSRQGDRDFVKVLDFGLAKVATGMLAAADVKDGAGQALTKHGTVFGTPKYMSPEQCISEPVDGRTDLYALGLILYEMLAGAHPFASKDLLTIIRHQLSTQTPSLAQFAPKVRVPAALEALILRLTEKRRENRFTSATELLSALDQITAKEGILPPAAAARPPVSSPPSPAAEPSTTGQTVSSVDVISEDRAERAPAAAAAPVKTPPPATDAARAPAAGPRAVDKSLAPLLARMPAVVQRTPALLLAPLVLLGIFIWLAARSGSPASQTPGSPESARNKPQSAAVRAPQAQLDQAIAQGLQALLTLSGQYPQDVQVQRALAHTYMAQQNGAEALRWLGKVVAQDSALVRDGELLQAAGMGLGSPASADSIIAVLESELGTRGIDVLYTLSMRPLPAKLKARLNQSLAKPEVRARATPATVIALDLRAAESCEAKRALLPLAGRYGDRRTQQQLTLLKQTHNCGPYGLKDCYRCLHQDEALASALTAIAARVKSEP